LRFAVRTLSIALGLGFVLSSSPVLAQGAASKKKAAPEQNDADAEARRVFKEGDKLYAEGDYEGAVSAFEKAYELSHQAALKYNLANAYERLARYDEAYAALKEYEPHAPDDERDVVRRRLKKLKERASQQERDKTAQAAVKPAAEPAGSTASPEPPAAEPTGPASTASTAAPADGGSPPILGYALIGVGAVGIGVGSVFGIQALGARSDAEGMCSSGGGVKRCPSSAGDSLSANKRDAILADVGIGVGIVAAAVGTYLVIKGHSKEAPSAQVQAGAGPHGGQISLVGTF